MSLVRILLVDDSLAFLKSAARFLSEEETRLKGSPEVAPATSLSKLKIVGWALSGREALEQIPQLYPDLVLMDLAMPEMNGLEATRCIKTQPNAPYVIILTLNDSAEYRAAAETVGADGLISKSEFGTALLPLIYSLLIKKGVGEVENT